MTRINARLDPALAGKIRALRARTGRSTTEIIKDSLDAYYESVIHNGNPRDLLSELVGCGSGSPSLSDDYKGALTRSLARKTRP